MEGLEGLELYGIGFNIKQIVSIQLHVISIIYSL